MRLSIFLNIVIRKYKVSISFCESTNTQSDQPTADTVYKEPKSNQSSTKHPLSLTTDVGNFLTFTTRYCVHTLSSRCATYHNAPLRAHQKKNMKSKFQNRE